MKNVNFINLIDLLNTYPEQIEIIKEQYLLLLSELTLTTYIETPLFLKNIERINQMGSIIIGYIGSPLDNNFEIVVSGTIIIEPKIIRGGKNVGHIEDIIVSKIMRKKGLAQEILNMLKTIARENNCYKVSLNCKDDIKKVYMKNGLKVKEIQMCEYF